MVAILITKLVMMLNMDMKPSAPVGVEVGMAATMDDVMRNRVMMGRSRLCVRLLSESFQSAEVSFRWHACYVVCRETLALCSFTFYSYPCRHHQLVASLVQIPYPQYAEEESHLSDQTYNSTVALSWRWFREPSALTRKACHHRGGSPNSSEGLVSPSGARLGSP